MLGGKAIALNIALIILCFCLLISGLLVGVTVIQRQLNREQCQNTARLTGRDVKFASYNYFNFECIVKDTNGKWVSYNNIIPITGVK
jgi:hypothetical protein